MQAAPDLAKVRQSQDKIIVRRLARPGDLGHFRPALVEGIADRAAIETSRKLHAALTK